MAPRCGKRRCRVRNPMPVWLPLPRPCLRGMNMPCPPYYIPISPEMCLPPWTLPPSCFTKPMCHCANEDFCTTSNCVNSPECLKMHPMFCPHGIKDKETSDLQLEQQQQQNNDDQETSSDSDLNICSNCGASLKQLRTIGTKTNSEQNDQPRRPSKLEGIQDSFMTSPNLEQSNQAPPNQNINLERNNISTGRNLTSRERDITSKFDHYPTPETALSNNRTSGCGSSSCQTSFSNSRTQRKNRLTIIKKNNLKTPRRHSSAESMTNYADDSETSLDRNVSTPSRTYSTPNNATQNELDIHKELEETTTEFMRDNMYADQLSNTGETQASKYTPNETDTSEPIREMVDNNTNKSRKKSKCGCYSTPGKTSSKLRKLTDCICHSTKIPFKGTKMSKCDCSPNKISYKHSSRLHKLSECGCSSTKITHKNISGKVSKSSSPSSDLTQKYSSKSRKVSASEFSSTEGIMPDTGSSTKLANEKSNKSFKDITSLSATNVKEFSCQCKFPPAYEHLSCTGNLSNNCNCSNNT